MTRTFVLPDLGEGLVEAEIRAVLVHEGDVVKEDSPLLEVETDKAQVEIPSPFAGRVEKIHVEPGQTVKVGQPLVSFADGAGAPASLASAPAAAKPAARAAPPAPAPAVAGGPVAAAPSTRRLAREMGVDLHAVRGSGPAGRITEFLVPTANSGPRGITAGPDGNLWFTELNASKIGRITPAGRITEFHLIAICVFSVGCGPFGITAGPDGNLWFTEFDGNAIGRITPSGSFSVFGIPTAKSRPEGITAGPDGNLWFTEAIGNKIGRITTS